MQRNVNRRNGNISLDKEAEEYAEKIAAARRGVVVLGIVLLIEFWFVGLIISWWRS